MSLLMQAHGKVLPPLSHTVLGKVTSVQKDWEARGDYVLVAEAPQAEMDLEGYAAVLIHGPLMSDQEAIFLSGGSTIVHSVSSIDHLEEGDVVAVQPSGYIRTLYRVSSPHNSLFTTDRCNSYCLMCSQPPKPVDDSKRIREHLRLIELIHSSTRELGITGGEPTLLKGDLLRVIERCKALLPTTALHILSNGRLFYYGTYACDLAAIEHPDLMIGIPLYSDIDSEHDYVVQAAGAFDQTMVGLQNLGRYGVRVELRVVLHRHTYQRLPRLAEFIYYNLPFASHVALMGLETIGFAVPNLAELWIDPADYSSELREAVELLAYRGMSVSVYNHQLCVVPREIWPYCRKSISDWKNDYLRTCDECAVKESCGGFFTSSLRRRHSSFIHPIQV
jgi:His-Xaa-Ser system radical SAM maturase HxsC